MPTYEFRCPDGTIIERIFKISEVPQTIPTPDGTGVATRIISGGADLIFKGSGFYITDYGKDGKRDMREKAKTAGASDTSTAPSGGSGAKAESGSSAPASDAKPAAPKDAKPEPKKKDPSPGAAA